MRETGCASTVVVGALMMVKTGLLQVPSASAADDKGGDPKARYHEKAAHSVCGEQMITIL
jgi:hypothetical protein